MTAQITNSSKVTLHFELALANGDVIDSTFDAEQPAVFTMGDGSLLPGFEAKLVGMAAGAENTFTILPEEGFGQPAEANFQRVPRSLFDEEGLELGMVMSFANGPEGELPGVIHAIEDEEVTVNFNHPLSGEVLAFRVEILAVE